ncbi:MAG: beta strand repeat-containing protein [Acidimicrobiia bacterium]
MTEGTGGTNFAVVQVSNFGIPAGQCSFLFVGTADGSAQAPGDYSATGTPVFFNASGTQTVSIPIVTDNTDEASPETFTANLIDLGGGCTATTIVDASATVSITDDDPAPTVNIADATPQAEGNPAGLTPFTFNVTLSNPSQATTFVSFTTSNGTATTADNDYQAAAGTLTFGPGVTLQTVTVNVVRDATNEPDETFNVTLTGTNSIPGGFAPVIGDGAAVGTILNDDGIPTINITDGSATEGANVTFTVSRSAASASATTVLVSTANGTAVAPGDYTALVNQLVTIPAGPALSTTVSVTTIDDAAVEGPETFTANLSGPTNGVIGDGQGLGTINDNDAIPNASIPGAPGVIVEGNVGSSTFLVPVTLSNPTNVPVTIDYQIDSGGITNPATVSTPNVDYQAVAFAQITIPAGQTTGNIPVVVFGDLTQEASEFVRVLLIGSTNATFTANGSFPLIVTDDGIPTVTINDLPNIVEGNAGTANAVFTVTLSQAFEDRFLVDFTTANGSAVAPSDFTATAGTLLIQPGFTTGTISVPVVGDVFAELNESFTVNLSNPAQRDRFPNDISNAGFYGPQALPAGIITDGQGVGTIINDDAPAPVLDVADATITEGNAGTQVLNFVVSLSSLTNVAVTFNASTANISAAAGSDYVALVNAPFTIPANTGSINVGVTINGDTTFEPNETFQLNITNIVNANGGDTQALGTILNNDLPTITSVSDPVVAEGTGPGVTTAIFTLTLDGAAQAPGSVTVNTANVSAVAPGDYSALVGQVVNFGIGDTSANVTVNIVRDNVTEPNETFTLNLSGAANVIIGDPSGTATITNDDFAPSPVVTGLAPNNGTSSGGTQVIIVGSNLATATSVNFGGINVPFFVNGNDLVVNSPGGFPGDVFVTVTNPGGTSPTGPGSTFTYV